LQYYLKYIRIMKGVQGKKNMLNWLLKNLSRGLKPAATKTEAMIYLKGSRTLEGACL